ncbi:hypothetical protein [Pseudomonas sp. 65/3-MNA-CIBAN-0223]|uniref:hypothetical protein n=1 Tax=Pseudomonas sp. 65/3-MNA-CIBAN-0223 TaxID=3140476 RepID=UPI00331EDF5A
MKQNLIAKAIVLLLTSRVLIDIIFSRQKPQILIVFYTIFILSLSLYLILTSKATIGRSNLTLILLLMSTVLLSLLNSNVGFVDHISFSLQVLTPIIFLLSCSGRASVLAESGKIFKKYIAAPALILILTFSYLDYRTNGLGQSFFDYYANQPNHVFAQTNLKISLLFFESIPFTVAGFMLLGTLNVRSTIASFIFSFLTFHKNKILKKSHLIKIVMLAFLVVTVFVIFTDIDLLLERVIFKNRTTGSSGSIDNFSSGRSEIYLYYGKYLLEKFTVLDWIVGKGPIWLDPKEFNLSAHNDFFNLIVSYGLLGFILICFAYYKFFSSLPKNIRPAAAICFFILFLVNGVVFHQSTILFSLLYIYALETRHSNRT